LERTRLGIVDVLIALVAVVPWRTTLLIVLQLSIIVRTFDAYLKWALPILFVAGPVFAWIRDRRAARLGLAAPLPRSRAWARRPGRTRVLHESSVESDALRGVSAR
jgi:hypothetical protein